MVINLYSITLINVDNSCLLNLLLCTFQFTREFQYKFLRKPWQKRKEDRRWRDFQLTCNEINCEMKEKATGFTGFNLWGFEDYVGKVFAEFGGLGFVLTGLFMMVIFPLDFHQIFWEKSMNFHRNLEKSMNFNQILGNFKKFPSNLGKIQVFRTWSSRLLKLD